ncbi:unnamed protein product [Medioppia subpectinata]|uniref:DNA repair protein rad9 n=1 Tax=Medioppia subpectinata TaxID=1979941 RepID=A0A7R9KHZ9_9ACAR|nr:unnamed protein product [Medioppia subpectinata]CAG2102513.1 unnamed protein product [Medioppia subpectinata]
MRLQAINDNKTAFIQIQFDMNFFSSFECIVDTKCKLLLKSLILVFRVVNLDKTVENCTIIMDETMPRVVFDMKCLNGVSREYFVPYMESSNLQYNSIINSMNPSFKVQSKQLSECLHNFSNETKDVTLWLKPQQILFKSYFDDIEEQNIMTSFEYNSRHFQNYCVNQDITVTFDVKDLRTFLDFTSLRDQTIECYFQASGKPIEFAMKSNDYYLAKLTLATHDFPDGLTPVPPSMNRTVAQSSHQSSSLLGTGVLTEENGSPINSMPTTSIHMTSSEGSALPNSIRNTFTTNRSNGQNINAANIENPVIEPNEGEFDEEEDDIFEQILSHLPQFASGNSEARTPAAFPLSGVNTVSQINRYQRSVVFGEDDDDGPIVIYGGSQPLPSQDAFAEESDPEDNQYPH